MLWAGAQAGTRLYTGMSYDGGAPLVEYTDCGVQKSSDCGKAFYILQFPLCEATGRLPEFVLGKGHRRQRGVPVVTGRGNELGATTLLLTGRYMVLILWGSKGGVKEVNALRKISEQKAEGQLPPPVFPVGEIRRMKKIKRIFIATQSVAATADRMKMRPKMVRDYLRTSRNIRAHGDYGTMACPKRG